MRRLLPLALVACAEAPLEATGVVTEVPWRSEIVDDDYLLRVRTPPDDGGPWPLVVQLDPTYAGLRQFEHTVGLVSQRAAAGDGTEAVVVGVDYPEPSTRERDYRTSEDPDPDYGDPGADTFYAVLRDELLPALHDMYDLDPTRRILVGHSNGGVFGIYAALRADAEAGALFSGVVAADFGVDQALFVYEGWLAERADDLPVRLYASRAVFNGAVQQITHEALFDRLRGRDYPSLALRTEVLETDHGGAVVPSFTHGLAHTLWEAP